MTTTNAQPVAETHDELLEATLAEMAEAEPDEILVPTFIDEQLEQKMSLWYIAYSTS